MGIFGNYASYYDLLYSDKDYAGEVRYVHQLFQTYAPDTQSLLELGCGTGNHAQFLAKMGYQVYGVERSEEMLRQAHTRLALLPPEMTSRLRFVHGDIRQIRIDQQFDAILSFFHVLSYQTTNADLQALFATVRAHLTQRGIFIFDCWYGPGVLSDRPTVRVKRMENENIRVIRIAEPVMDTSQNTVAVNYQVLITEKANQHIEEIRECHRMRYLFIPEITKFLSEAGMSLVAVYESFTEKPPKDTTWNVHVIGQLL